MSQLSRSADTAQAYEDKDDIEKFLPLALALSQADFFGWIWEAPNLFYTLGHQQDLPSDGLAGRKGSAKLRSGCTCY